MSDPDVIARLRELVARHGSISAAARLLGLPPSCISGVLRGDHGPGRKLYRALGIAPPPASADSLPEVDPADAGRSMLRAYILRRGSCYAAAVELGMSREHLRLVVRGRYGIGPKLARALELDDGTAAIERRLLIARELKRQSWERGRFAIPKAKLAEIR